jgi:hypothetical protein
MAKTKTKTVVQKRDALFKTTLWVKEKGATFFRLMNTITATSMFVSANYKGLDTADGQWAAAVDQMEGWRRNGGMGSARFKIVQTDINHPDLEPKTQHYGPGSYNANHASQEGAL